jgi:hypothetical protein
MGNDNDLIRGGDAMKALDWGDIYGRNAQDAIAALPAAPMGVKAGEIERIVWRAMLWAACNDSGFIGTTAYTDNGNSFAEEEARAAARRILAALEPSTPTLGDALGLPEVRALVEAAQEFVDDGFRSHSRYRSNLNAALAALKGGAE